MNLQQKTFCYEYLKDFNAVQAYKRAKYSSRGAEHNAYKLLKNPDIDKLIQEELSKTWDMSKDQWLHGLIDLKKQASKYSDKIRCMELYGKSRNYIGADTTIQNVNYYSQALDKLKQRPIEPIDTTNTNKVELPISA